nr:CDP-glycerol glycerophosphotransferase family protein [uncultured Lachnoclostridium sp.]
MIYQKYKTRIEQELNLLKNKGIKTICIWHPCFNIGGGGIYYCKLAEWLSEYTDFDIYFVDYYHGFPSYLLQNTNVKILNYSRKLTEFPLKVKCAILVNITRVIRLPNMRSDNLILFWNYETNQIGFDSLFINGKKNIFFRLLKENNALCYHDWSGRATINYYEKQNFTNNDYLYIVVPPKKLCATNDLVEENCINISCVQRISHDKIESAKYLIKALNKLSKESTFQKIIKLHFIGDGDYRNYLEDFATQFQNSKLEFIFTGAIPYERLDHYLTTKIDLSFAMGQAAIDSAALKIPTAVFLLSLHNIDDDEVFWLFDTKEKCVGITTEMKKAFGIKYVSIADVVKSICKPNGKAVLGLRSYNYYLKEHSDFNLVGINFITFLNKDTFTFSLLKNSFKYIPLCDLSIDKIFFRNILIAKKINFCNFSKVEFLGITLLNVINNKEYTDYFILKKIHFRSIKKSPFNFPIELKNDASGLWSSNALESRKEIRKKFKNNQKIKICLQMTRPGNYAFGDLYALLKKDGRFDPFVLITPDKNYRNQINFMLEFMHKAAQEAEIITGDKPILGFNEKENKVLNLRKILNPDVIFYSDFMFFHFFDEFYFNKFLDKFTLLTEYGFSCMEDRLTCNYNLNNDVDIYFRQSNVHLEMSKKYMKNHGKNVIISGSAKLDVLFNGHNFKDVWPKRQNNHVKRIIWAPHHGSKNPKSMYVLDSFFILADFMLEIAKKYSNYIQIAFRPHPLLQEEIQRIWGVEKTNKYWNSWTESKNTFYFTGSQYDLFYYSDAMIMDCCSFIAEYTAFNKPVFYTASANVQQMHMNEFGSEILKFFYRSYKESSLKNDILNFIEDVVLKGHDKYREERDLFVRKYFKKYNNLTSSENMYNSIIKLLEGNEQNV